MEDGAIHAGPGQVVRSEFVVRAAAAIRQGVDDELRGTGWSADDCPYLEHVLRHYRERAAADVEAVVVRWARPSEHSVDGFLSALADRARESARRFRSNPQRATRELAADLPLPGGVPLPRALGKATGGRARPVDALEAQASLGAGRPIEPSVWGDLQTRLGSSLDHVRVHTGGEAAALTRAAGVHALTVGDHVAFAPGLYRPDTLFGQALLLHELAHTIQQRRPGSASDGVLERDADRAALEAMLLGRGAPAAAGGLRLSGCQPDPPAPRIERPPLDAPTQLITRYRDAERLLFPRGFHNEPGLRPYEWVIDADGDQSAELHVRLDREESDRYGRPSSITVELQYEGSDATQRHTFQTAGDMFFYGFAPRIEQISDGFQPTRFALSQSGRPSLDIGVPTRGETSAGITLTYTGRDGAGNAQNEQSATVFLEGQPGDLLQVFRPGPVQRAGPIWSLDADVGAHGDRIRVSVVRDLPFRRSRSETHAVRIAVTPMASDGRPLGGGGETTLAVDEPLDVSVVESGDTGLALDLDGDGRADVTIYDAAQGRSDTSSYSTRVRPERFRRHVFSLVPAGGRSQWIGSLTVEEGRIDVPRRGREEELPQAAAATAAASRELAGGAATRDDTLLQLDDVLTRLRGEALEDGTVPEELAHAYRELETAMLALATGTVQTPWASARARALSAAQSYGAELQQIATDFDEWDTDPSGMSPVTPFENPVTGEEGYSDVMGERVVTERSTTAALIAQLEDGEDDAALATFGRIVERFDHYIELRRRELHGEDDQTANRIRHARQLRERVAELPQRARVMRAVFHLRQSFEEQALVQDIPQVMFYWRDGDEWQIKILTNPDPDKTREVSVDASSTDGGFPSHEGLASALDDRDIFPQGFVTYQFPGGPGGRFETTEPWEWEDVFRWAATALALAGLGLVALATWGGAAPVVGVVGGYLLAGSGLAAAAGGAASMLDNAADGNWVTTTWLLDGLDIVTGLAGGLSAAGRVGINAARQGVNVSRVGRVLANQFGQGARFVRLTAVSMGGDVIQGLLVADQFVEQFQAIEGREDLPEHERTRLKLLLLQNAAFSAGLMAISVVGNAGDLRAGRPMMVEDIDGVPVLRSGASTDFGEVDYRRAVLDELGGPSDPGQRSRQLAGADDADLPEGIALEVVPSRQFVEDTGSHTGEAVVRFRRGPDGEIETVLVIREHADPAVVRRELVHAQQLESRALRPHIARLTEENLARWPQMGAVERYRVAQSKLLVELDAQRRIIARAGGPGASEADAVEAEIAFQHVDNLQRQLDELTSVDPRSLPDDLTGAPAILREPHPPRLFSKTPASGADLEPEYANMDVDEFIAAYEARYPDSTLSRADLEARHANYQRLHPRTGRLRGTVSAGAGSRRFRAEHEVVQPDVVAVAESPHTFEHVRSAATQPAPDETTRLLRERDAARADRQRLEQISQRTPAQELELSRARGRMVEASRRIGGAGADLAVRARFADAQEVRRIYPPEGTPSRSGDFDLVYLVIDAEGRRMFVVVEAKGGGARLGTARVDVGGGAQEIHEQGTRSYFLRTQRSMERFVDDIPDEADRGAMEDFLNESPDSPHVRYLLAETPIENVERLPAGGTREASNIAGVTLSEFDISAQGEAHGRSLASARRRP